MFEKTFLRREVLGLNRSRFEGDVVKPAQLKLLKFPFVVQFAHDIDHRSAVAHS